MKKKIKKKKKEEEGNKQKNEEKYQGNEENEETNVYQELNKAIENRCTRVNYENSMVIKMEDNEPYRIVVGAFTTDGGRSLIIQANYPPSLKKPYTSARYVGEVIGVQGKKEFLEFSIFLNDNTTISFNCSSIPEGFIPKKILRFVKIEEKLFVKQQSIERNANRMHNLIVGGLKVALCHCSNPKYSKKNKIAIQMMTNNEHHLFEFFEYHFSVGIDAIIIYWNGKDDSFHKMRFLFQDYIANNTVIMIDWSKHYRKGFEFGINKIKGFPLDDQLSSKNDGLVRFKDFFEFIMFTDNDEYVVPKSHETIFEVIQSLEKKNKKKNKQVASYLLLSQTRGPNSIGNKFQNKDHYKYLLNEMFFETLDVYENRTGSFEMANYTHSLWNFRKIIAKTDCTLGVLVHEPQKWLEGFSNEVIAEDLMVINHIRFFKYTKGITNQISDEIYQNRKPLFITKYIKKLKEKINQKSIEGYSNL